MANRDLVNTILKQHLLENILPKLFVKYNNQVAKYNAYLVVIGGLSVEMCARLNKDAQIFLKNVFSEDIDIKAVCKKNSNISRISSIRHKFLLDVIKELEKFINVNKSRWDKTIILNVELDTSLMTHAAQAVKDAQVMNITIDYTESSYRTQFSILDTSLFTPKVHHYNVYKSLVGGTLNVPYYTENNINFATCDYMMYDNCRMMIDRSRYLKEKRSMFAMLKFIKYVIKFMSLYILRNKISKLPSHLQEIYSKAYLVLKKLNTHRLKKGLKDLYKIKYDEEYVDHIISVLDTLIKASKMKHIMKAIETM